MDNLAENLKGVFSYGPGTPQEVKADQIEDIVNMVIEKKEYAEGEMDELRDKWEDIKTAYESEKEWVKSAGVKDPEAKIHTPEMMSQIDTMVQMHTIRMLQPYVNFIQVQHRKTRRRVYKIENYLFDMFKKNGMAPEIISAILSAALYGVGFTKIIPDMDVNEPSCLAYHVSNWDIFPEPYAKSMSKKDCAFVVEQMWITYEDLMENKELYNKVGDEFNRMLEEKDLLYLLEDDPSEGPVNELRGGGSGSSNDKARTLGRKWLATSNIDRMGMREVEPPSDEKYGRIKLYIYYDRDSIITVADDEYLLSIENYALEYPFQAWRMRIGSAGEFWVKSHGEFILPLQQEIDMKRNQRIDNVNRINDPPFVYQKASIDNIKKFVIKSGAKQEVNNLDGLKWLEITDATNNTMSEVDVLKGDIQRITGVSAVVQGGAAKKERMTKDETSNVYQQANMTFDAGSSVMVLTGMLPMFNLILKYCATIFKGEIAQAGAGPNLTGEMEEIMPSEFNMNYDVTAAINPNKVMQDKQNAIELYQLFSQHPNITQPVLLNWIIPRLSEDYPPDLINDGPTGEEMPQDVQLSNR